MGDVDEKTIMLPSMSSATDDSVATAPNPPPNMHFHELDLYKLPADPSASSSSSSSTPSSCSSSSSLGLSTPYHEGQSLPVQIDNAEHDDDDRPQPRSRSNTSSSSSHHHHQHTAELDFAGEDSETKSFTTDSQYTVDLDTSMATNLLGSYVPLQRLDPRLALHHPGDAHYRAELALDYERGDNDHDDLDDELEASSERSAVFSLYGDDYGDMGIYEDGPVEWNSVYGDDDGGANYDYVLHEGERTARADAPNHHHYYDHPDPIPFSRGGELGSDDVPGLALVASSSSSQPTSSAAGGSFVAAWARASQAASGSASASATMDELTLLTGVLGDHRSYPRRASQTQTDERGPDAQDVGDARAFVRGPDGELNDDGVEEEGSAGNQEPDERGYGNNGEQDDEWDDQTEVPLFSRVQSLENVEMSGIDLALARGIGLARTMTTQDVLFNHLSSTSSLLPDNFSTIEPPAEASSPLSSSSSAESDSPPIYIQPSSSSKPAISSLQTLLVAATAPSLSSSSSSPSAPLHAQLSHSHLNITRVLTASSSTQLAVFLNDPERRRDPWNLALPTEILQFGGATTNSGSEHAPADNMTRRGSSHSSKWTFLVQKSWSPTAPSLSGALSAGGSVNPIADPSLASSTADSAEGLYYYRPWNDPPLRTIRDVFDFVQQLLEGLVFFHENSLTRIPFTPSNIVMDTGLALDPDLDWDPDGDDEELRYRSRRDTSATDSNMEGAELDRAAFPVKYYLARMEGVRFVAPLDSRDATTRPMTSSDQHEGRKDDHENLDEYAEDIVRLGKLIKELFASIVDDPLKLLYEFMLSAATPTSASPLSPLSPAASSLSSSPLFASSPLPQSSSPLHPQNAIKACDRITESSILAHIVHPPTASSSLELLHFIEARFKKLGMDVMQRAEMTEI